MWLTVWLTLSGVVQRFIIHICGYGYIHTIIWKYCIGLLRDVKGKEIDRVQDTSLYMWDKWDGMVVHNLMEMGTFFVFFFLFTLNKPIKSFRILVHRSRTFMWDNWNEMKWDYCPCFWWKYKPFLCFPFFSLLLINL